MSAGSSLVKQMLGEVGLVPGARTGWSIEDPLEERREVAIGREVQSLLPVIGSVMDSAGVLDNNREPLDRIRELADELIQMHSPSS